MVEDNGKSSMKEEFTTALVEWLDFVRGETSELQFEKDIGLARNSIRNMREGKVPGAEKLAQIKRGTGVAWETLGSLLEASFIEETDEELPKERYLRNVNSYDLLIKLVEDMEIVKFQIEKIAAAQRPHQYMKMVAECLAEKTKEEIKARFDFLRIPEDEMDWETFQAIAANRQYPQSKRQFDLIRVLVDDDTPPKYSVMEWFTAFFALVVSEPSLDSRILSF
ncbi:MAG: hypothetical protein J7647_14325 [Cyanobacteria bacterium SBLK]|nr:hypothetical protein [Cyanobacteria bacterium SBLK]